MAMAEPPKPRSFRMTPDRLVVLLLVVEVLLWLSGWYQWFPFNREKGLTFLIGIAVIGVGMLFLLLWYVVAVKSCYRFQFSTRSSLMLIAAVVAIPCNWAGEQIYRYGQHRRVVERIEDVVDELAERYPDGVPPKHWDNAVFWTWNAIGNCLAVPDFFFDEKDAQGQFVRFADELEQKAKGQVGPETIDWIWDEIVRLSRIGQSYSDKWRPVHGGRLDEVEGDKLHPYSLVSTTGSRLFHKRDCPLVSKLPWREKSRSYSVREAAIESGMSPCPSCNP